MCLPEDWFEHEELNVPYSRSNELPRIPIALLVTGLATLVIVLLRFYWYGNRLVPLTLALPLLLGLWHQRRAINWGCAATVAVLGTIQVFFWVQSNGSAVDAFHNWWMIQTNIWVMAVVVDRQIVARWALVASNVRLETANQELEANNEELAAREEEISMQNEELQRQSEELEQQMEELQQQTEELQQQQDDLQAINEESANREHVLQTMLEITSSMTKAGGLQSAAGRICEASLVAYDGEVSGATLLVQCQDDLHICGACRMQLGTSAQPGSIALQENQLFRLVMAEGKTVAIDDLAHTGDLIHAHQADGTPFRALLAAPLKEGDRPLGVLLIGAAQPRVWCEADFSIVHWLAAQGTQVLTSARLQEELDERTRQAEEASRRKTRFLAAVSHDVRTPANAISLLAEVIQQSSQHPEMQHEIPQLAHSLRSNAKLLVELVSDVLDLSRFDSGRIDLENTNFDLNDVIRAEVNQYQSLAKAAGIDLVSHCSSTSLWLNTDRMKLARVLGNLIGNAVKFTDQGHVAVRCGRNAQGVVEIQVEDTGVGIPSEHFEHIFDEFYQINNPERDRSKGTGLGLAICKRLVDAIGCSLSVRSIVGSGTTFTIRVPEELIVASPHPISATQPQPAAATQNRLDQLRVLIVEDHEATRQAVVSLLSSRGAIVDQAVDGRTCLRLLRHQVPDVLLLDLMLPDMDGREILKNLVSERPPELRCLLAVSGDVTEQRRQEVELLGADGLVAKPVQIETLISRIQERLARTDDITSGADVLS